jgi:hypothetical protein
MSRRRHGRFVFIVVFVEMVIFAAAAEVGPAVVIVVFVVLKIKVIV